MRLIGNLRVVRVVKGSGGREGEKLGQRGRLEAEEGVYVCAFLITSRSFDWVPFSIRRVTA